MRALAFLTALGVFTLPAKASTLSDAWPFLDGTTIQRDGEMISPGNVAIPDTRVPDAELEPTPADAPGRPPVPASEQGVTSPHDHENAAAKPHGAATRVTRDAAPPASHEEICSTLAESAQAHDLPVGFFGNLIWQESRFDPRSVSRAGAQGVAQFMPKVASEVGLANPFNPFEALPAAARLLSSLFRHFGNFGLAAAAYNAGPGRVSNWLSKGKKLPGETRHYVLTVTGRPAEVWRGAAPKPVLFKLPSRMPCRNMEVFAHADAAARAQEAQEQAQERAREQAERERIAAEHAARKPSAKAASVRIAMNGLRRVHEAKRKPQVTPAKPTAHKTAATGRPATKGRHGKVAAAG